MGHLVTNIEVLRQIPRTCDRCAHQYEAAIRLEGSGGSTSRRSANRQARTEIATQTIDAHDDTESFGVLCPKCHRFSTKSMARYFPDGFHAGLRKIFTQEIAANEGLLVRFGPNYQWKAFLVTFLGAILVGYFFAYSLQRMDGRIQSFRIPNPDLFLVALFGGGFVTVLQCSYWLCCVYLRKKNALYNQALAALDSFNDSSSETFVVERYFYSKLRLNPNAYEWAKPLIGAHAKWNDPRPVIATKNCKMCGATFHFKSIREAMVMDCPRCGKADPFNHLLNAGVIFFFFLGVVVIFAMILGGLGNSSRP